MSRTITAMFDSRSEAEAARERLSASSIDADRVRIIDQSSSGSASGSSGSPGEEGFFASLKDLFMPDEDRHAYGEGIRRGGYMLVAEVDESDADRACDILEQSSSVDFEERQSEWRNQGWAGYQGDRQAGAFGALGGQQETSRTDSTMASGNHLGATAGTNVQEEHIPIVNEELRVGKREVERGGARVRSYVREVPVHEQVNLREEHVEIERRPVSGEYRQGAMGGDVFQEREIEMTEHAEEAVVSKEARVQEELVIRKTAEERTETIDDTVRHTEVDVDEGRSAFTGFDRDRDGDMNNDGVRDDLERSGTNRDRGLL